MGKTSRVQRAISSIERHPRLSAALLFGGFFLVYAVNFDPWQSGDMFSNSVFAFNILEFRKISLDAFPYTQFGMSFWVAPPGTLAAGRVTLGYPPGTAILTFPLYVIFYVWYQLIGAPASITSLAFDPYRLAFSHLAAAFLSAATVALFFVILRRRFSTRTVLVVTACLGLASYQWGMLAQSLQQHGPSSFVALFSAYLLLRATDTQMRSAVSCLAAAGALAGFLYFIRPTNLAFAAALTAFAILHFRSRSLIFVVGFAVTFSAALFWNWTFFGHPAGSGIAQTHSFNLSPATFVEAFTGIMLSPSRGIIPTQPFLLFAAAGCALAVSTLFLATVRRDFSRHDPDILLFSMLFGASAVLLIAYSFSPFWTSNGYGIRYLSETLPFVVYFLAFSPTIRGTGPAWRRVLFGAFFAIGLLNQVTAALGGMTAHQQWGNFPYGDVDRPVDRAWDYLWDDPLRRFETRSWDFIDTLFIRTWRGLYASRYEFNYKIASATNYAARCKATIVDANDADGRGLKQVTLRMSNGTFYDAVSGRRKFVRLKIRNDGEVPLHSYATGLTWGMATVSHKVFAEDGRPVYENGTVYLTRRLAPGETGEAIGSMQLPLDRGRYRIEVRMATNGIGFCGQPIPLGTLVIE